MSARTIYVGTDFSPASARAFDVALEMARSRGAELVVGHVIDTPGFIGYGVGDIAREIEKRIREDCSQRLEALRRRADRAGVPARTELLAGCPQDALAEAAERAHATMLVLGTNGRTGVSRLVMGSVAGRLVCTAPCPVLTVKETVAA
ncbi:MAG: universal stress protein [Acidobacteriota bacterium]|nr:universal stress protein [Acidobacteriota bacterium]